MLIIIKYKHSMITIQTQTQYDYYKFFVMLINDFFCIRIKPDKELFEKISRQCKLFFEKAILRELLPKCFSESTITNAINPGKVCYCNMDEEDDDLIGCGNKNCQTKWFLLKCLHITKISKGRWFCLQCPKLKKQKNNCSWIYVWFIIHWYFFHIGKVFIANKYMFSFIIYV